MDGITAATIPIRDANGRMKAADPASGATDKTLVTANWVSQSGDSAPNNLMHRNGNETKTGNITVATAYPRYVFKITNYNSTTPPGVSLDDRGNIRWLDMNDVEIGSIRFNIGANGETYIQAKVKNGDGTNKYVILAGGNP